jgi:hypothetical protein
MKPILTRQIIPIGKQSATLGGAAVSFQIPRESLIDKMVLYAEGVFSAAAATAAAEGLAKLVKSVSLSGSLAGGRIEPIAGLDGPELSEFSQIHCRSLAPTIGALTSAAAFRVEIPLHFRNYGFSSEAKNLLTALPAWQMSDLTMNVTPASQADCDVHATPTLAASALKFGVEVHQYFRETVPDNIVTIRSTLERSLDNNPATESPHEVKLPSGGDYDSILLRAFAGANTRQTDAGTTGPITNPDGYIRLFELSRTTKFDTNYHGLRSENLRRLLDSLVTGNAAFLFGLDGEAQLFQTGAIGQALNNVLIQYQSTNISGGKVDFVYRRIFDPNNYLGITR